MISDHFDSCVETGGIFDGAWPQEAYVQSGGLDASLGVGYVSAADQIES